MARAKEFSHLVKPLLVQQPPDNLYAEPRVWMESKDLEGFNAHFSYGFLNHEGTYHPTEGMVVHPFDEILLFAGIDNEKAFGYWELRSRWSWEKSGRSTPSTSLRWWWSPKVRRTVRLQ